jgi:site-specific DNA-methyltransferase (adenine-specific)
MSDFHEVTIGRARLILGDCRDVLPTLGPVDAILSDPPYGQRANTNVVAGGEKANFEAVAPGQRYAARPGRRTNRGRVSASTRWPNLIYGDDSTFDPSDLLKASDRVLLWGAHKYGHVLPQGRLLVWDKVPTGKIRDRGDGEIAWTNVGINRPLRIFRHLWDGLAVQKGFETTIERNGAASSNPRYHPTQKPVDLMTWCFQFLELPQQSSIICDPYMGAGSSGIAAVRAGHRFIGIEIEPLYFESAVRRIEDAQRQGNLYAEEQAA